MAAAAAAATAAQTQAAAPEVAAAPDSASSAATSATAADEVQLLAGGSSGLPAGLPPGYANDVRPGANGTAGDVAPPSLRPQHRPFDKKRRVIWARLRRSPYFRRGVATALGTAAILGVCSIPAVWDALSLDPVLANCSIILVIFYMTLLVSLSSGQAPAKVAVEQAVGSVVGGIGIGVVYLVYALNGGTYHDTWAKAVAMVCFSGGWCVWGGPETRPRDDQSSPCCRRAPGPCLPQPPSCLC